MDKTKTYSLILCRYSHGFLFPSEVTRVRRNIVSYPDKTPQDILTSQPTTWPAPNTPTPAAWAHSSVSTFGVTYTPPVPGLTTPQGVEALVEGSDMSLIHEGLFSMDSFSLCSTY